MANHLYKSQPSLSTIVESGWRVGAGFSQTVGTQHEVGIIKSTCYCIILWFLITSFIKKMTKNHTKLGGGC